MNLKTEHPKVVPIGWLELVGEVNSPLPLLGTRVFANITGSLAEVRVEQEFQNPLQSSAEIAYLFPLSDKALLVGFELKIGSRLIRADLEELGKARHEYEDARAAGKQAALLEERGSNLFSLQIANVRPGESIFTKLIFQDKLVFRDGEYEFVFPMGVTPKYHSPQHPQEGDGVDIPIAKAGERIGRVEIALSVDAGVSVEPPASPTHKIKVRSLEGNRFEIRLEEPTLPDHDFVVRWRVSRDQAVLCGWQAKTSNGDFIFALVQPPALDALPSEPLPRQFIFVLDRSGSMSGEPIAQARNALRACLRSLNPQDIFSILLFDDQLEWFRPQPCSVTQENIDQADRYLDQVQGRGGTEIVQALQAALSLPPSPGRTRYLVFLTDGAVSVQQRAFDAVRSGIGNARLFTFGIGPSVNRGLLNRLAKYGRGASDFLQLDEDIEEAILRFQDRISFPALENLKIEWQKAKTWDVLPDPLPDLYAGEPLRITGRLSYSGTQQPAFTLYADQGGNPLRMETILQRIEPEKEVIVQRAWAHTRIEDLLDQMAMEPQKEHKIRNEIISLSLDYRVGSPYTAFVAVDSESRVEGGKPTLIRISQPLPQGLSEDGFVYSPPPTSGVLYASLPDLPAFMRRRSGSKRSAGALQEAPMPMDMLSQAGKMQKIGRAEKTGKEDSKGEDVLRMYARSQQVNGSWGDDVELTAAILLAFIRRGHTTHRGYYRKPIAKAVQWLQNASAAGFALFARAAVLAELAQATGSAEIQSAAQPALQTLPPPSSPAEMWIARKYLFGETMETPKQILELNDLRWAALCGASLPIPEALLKDELGKAWQAVMQSKA